MIQFKEVDGQLFELIEKPAPLTIDAEMVRELTETKGE